jgi:hypothetical protein
MAFPAPQPKRPRSPLAFAVLLLTVATVVILGGLYGVRQYANARAREQQRTLLRNERIAATHALLSNVRQRFPTGVMQERACEPGAIPSGTRTPLLAYTQLREGAMPSAGEAAIGPTKFVVTRDTALDAPVVAVLMTTDASIERAVYDGWIVVFDRHATALCQARVQAHSDTTLGELTNRVRGAERAAAQRLSPNLTLEL